MNVVGVNIELAARKYGGGHSSQSEGKVAEALMNKPAINTDAAYNFDKVYFNHRCIYS